MAGDGSKTPSNCVICQEPATRRCTGCLETRRYHERVLKPTIYCSPTCQQNDWIQHKPTCKKLQARRALGRAALFLQAIIYRIRLHALPFKFDKYHIGELGMFLDGYDVPPIEELHYLKPFPIHLVDNPRAMEAISVFKGCTEAMVYLHSFAKELLTDLCSKIEDVHVSVIGPKLRIIPIHLDGSQPQQGTSHIVYRVTLKNGELWAVDTTGAQFGYADPLCPWDEFEQQRSAKDIEAQEFGYVRWRQESHIMPDKVALAKILEKKIPALVPKQGGKLKNLLGGSNIEFEQAKERFLALFEDYLKASLTELYPQD